MAQSVDVDRRRFLKQTVGAPLAAATWPGALLAEEGQPGPKSSPSFQPDVELLMSAQRRSVDVLPGRKTEALRYEMSLVQGPAGTVTEVQGALSPTLRFQKGQRVRIRFRNELPDEDQIVHWHGLHVPEAADGHPRYAVKPQGGYLYEFEVSNRAGTCLYHSHTDRFTGSQVYRGLAGLILVGDDEERALELPTGAEDVPILIQDKRFDADNQLVYLQHPMEAHFGFRGDRILVNGRPDFVLSAETRPYRLRLANMSNSRIYKLAWKAGAPLTVIGTDGGLLAEPVQRPFLTLAPAERIDIWADFSGQAVGSELAVISQPISAGMPGMMMRQMGGMGMGGMGMGRGMGQGRRMEGGGPRGMGHDGMGMARGMGGGLENAFPIFRVRIERSVKPDGHKLPARLAPFRRYRLEDASNRGEARVITLSFHGDRGFLNGRSFEMTGVAPDERIPLDSVQLIEFVNPPGRGHGMMAAMPHPMHIHEQQFQILRRESFPGWEAEHAKLAAGFVDEGLKDTVLVLPGQRVTILKPFEKFTGLFLYHCHNLEHEDRGMMRNFLVFA
jgi:FtsP/CotA-like multicopper oxidase with cupredoxin domain